MNKDKPRERHLHNFPVSATPWRHGEWGWKHNMHTAHLYIEWANIIDFVHQTLYLSLRCIPVEDHDLFVDAFFEGANTIFYQSLYLSSKCHFKSRSGKYLRNVWEYLRTAQEKYLSSKCTPCVNSRFKSRSGKYLRAPPFRRSPATNWYWSTPKENNT